MDGLANVDLLDFMTHSTGIDCSRADEAACRPAGEEEKRAEKNKEPRPSRRKVAHAHAFIKQYEARGCAHEHD